MRRVFGSWSVIAFALLVMVGCGDDEPKGKLCSQDLPCPSGSICGTDGRCAALQRCSNSEECPANAQCVNKKWCEQVLCTDDKDCPEGSLCSDGLCVRGVEREDTTTPKPDLSSEDGSITKDTQTQDKQGSEDATTTPDQILVQRKCTSSNDCVGIFKNPLSCEEAVCVDGWCRRKVKTEGTSCDDGKFCTVGDQCNDNGECLGQKRDCSEKGDQCNEGICDDENDECTAKPHNDSTPCNDDTFCTINDHCDGAGKCVGKTRECPGSENGCMRGICDTTDDACKTEPKPDVAPCNDGKFCTQNDHCDGKGECIGGTIRSCTVLNDQCNVGYCDTTADSCQTQPKKKGSACNDGQFCTVNDECDGQGECTGGEKRNCVTGNDCMEDVCDETNDRCGVAKRFGTICKIANVKYSMCGTNADCRPWTKTTTPLPVIPKEEPSGPLNIGHLFKEICLSADGKSASIIGAYQEWHPPDNGNSQIVTFVSSHTISGATVGDAVMLYKVDGNDKKDPYKPSQVSVGCHNGTLVTNVRSDYYAPEYPYFSRVKAFGLQADAWVANMGLTDALNKLTVKPAPVPDNGDDPGDTDGVTPDPDAETTTPPEPDPMFGIWTLHDMKMMTVGTDNVVYLSGTIGQLTPSVIGCETEQCTFSRTNMVLRCAENQSGEWSCKNVDVDTLPAKAGVWTTTNLLLADNNGSDGLFVTSSLDEQPTSQPIAPPGPTTTIAPITNVVANGPSGSWMFSLGDMSNTDTPWTYEVAPGCMGLQSMVGDPLEPNPCWHAYRHQPRIANRDLGESTGFKQLVDHGQGRLTIVGGSTYPLGKFKELWDPGVIRHFDGQKWQIIETPETVLKASEIDELTSYNRLTYQEANFLENRYLVVKGSRLWCNAPESDGPGGFCQGLYNNQPFVLVYDVVDSHWSKLVPIDDATRCCYNNRCMSDNPGVRHCNAFREFDDGDEEYVRPPFRTQWTRDMKTVIDKDNGLCSINIIVNQPYEKLVDGPPSDIVTFSTLYNFSSFPNP